MEYFWIPTKGMLVYNFILSAVGVVLDGKIFEDGCGGYFFVEYIDSKFNGPARVWIRDSKPILPISRINFS